MRCINRWICLEEDGMEGWNRLEESVPFTKVKASCSLIGCRLRVGWEWIVF